MRHIARAGVPGCVFVLLVASALGDHYFRDEFYYLACSHRLDWGYVDQPPLSIAILWLVRHLAGESLLALRVAAAATTGLTVWLTGSIARRLGASAFGELLAMLALAVTPLLLAVGSYFSMNVFDLLAWTLAARVLVETLDRPTNTRWLILGLVLGLGLQNKISVLWLGAGLGIGLVLSPARRQLLTPGPWLAAVVAAAVFLPQVLWQWSHGWATLEFIRNASTDKMQANTPLAFLGDQIINMNPFTLPVWLAGLLSLLVAPRASRYRALGVAFLTVAAILILNGTSRSAYLAPAYPPLFAAGGVALERRITRRVSRVVCVSILVVAGALVAPAALPLLDVENYVRYTRQLGIAPGTEEKKEVGRLPQFFADRQGWDALVEQVAAAWRTLTPDERAHAAVLTGNYGEAAAIERLGKPEGIRAISGHNNYWYWGPGQASGDVLIVLGYSRERQEEHYRSVERAGKIDCGDCMPYENQVQIFICRGQKVLLSARWPHLKHFD